jgi:hypothetical protein
MFSVGGIQLIVTALPPAGGGLLPLVLLLLPPSAPAPLVEVETGFEALGGVEAVAADVDALSAAPPPQAESVSHSPAMTHR